MKVEREVGINEENTKYMCTIRRQGRDRLSQSITMDDYNFERVESFIYLGVVITIRGTSKLKVYRSVIRPIITYWSETWTQTKRNENKLEIFNGKILIRIRKPNNTE